MSSHHNDNEVGRSDDDDDVDPLALLAAARERTTALPIPKNVSESEDEYDSEGENTTDDDEDFNESDDDFNESDDDPDFDDEQQQEDEVATHIEESKEEVVSDEKSAPEVPTGDSDPTPESNGESEAKPDNSEVADDDTEEGAEEIVILNDDAGDAEKSNYVEAPKDAADAAKEPTKEASDTKPAETTDEIASNGGPSKASPTDTDSPVPTKRKSKSSKKTKPKRPSKAKLERLSSDEPLDVADLLAFAKRRSEMSKTLPSARLISSNLSSKESLHVLASKDKDDDEPKSQDDEEVTEEDAPESKGNNAAAKFFASAVSNMRSSISQNDDNHKAEGKDPNQPSPANLMGAINNAKSKISAAAASASTPPTYSLEQHAEYCNLRAEATINTSFVETGDITPTAKYFQYCDISRMLLYSNSDKLANSVKDYLSPVPDHDLKDLFCGTCNPVPKDEVTNFEMTNVLPVRTLAIRVRPDVSSAAIMDAVQAAFDKQPGVTTVLKRQGGHFQGFVDYEDLPTTSTAISSSFVMDAQLVTQAYSTNLERRLLIRIFHPWEVYNRFGKTIISADSAHGGDGIVANSTHSSSSNDAVAKMMMSSSSSRDIPLNLLLKQASSMIQHVQTKRRRAATELLTQSAKEMTHHLLNQYKESPTVRTCAIRRSPSNNPNSTPKSVKHPDPHNDQLILPALSAIDWALIQSSWTLLFRTWKELTQAQCEFSSMETIPLGSYPKMGPKSTETAPPVVVQASEESTKDDEASETKTSSLLDGMYVEQLRTLAQNLLLTEVDMVNQELLSTEVTNEGNASNFISLMSLAYAKYELERPPLLEEDDDKYVTGEDGVKRKVKRKNRIIDLASIFEECTDAVLQEELASITMSRSRDGAEEQDGIPQNDPIAFCEYVVKKAYAALSKQADQAQAQYMREKNLQLMRRHNALEIHQHTLIEHLYDKDNDWTAAAEHAFGQLAQKASNTIVNTTDNKKGRRLLKHMTQKQLPLFDFALSNNGGHCYVTRTLFLVSTTGVLLGQTKLFEFQQIRFELETPALKQSPTILLIFDVSSGKRLFKLKPEPTMPLERLLLFLTTLQEFQLKYYPMIATPAHKYT